MKKMMKFHKTQVSGNDFIIIDELISFKNDELRQLSIKLCDPHLGIGGDGIIYLYSSNYQYYVRFFNYNGQEVKMIGNGLSSIADYLYNEGIVADNCLILNTMAGEKHLRIIDEGIEIDYGIPKNVNRFRFEYFKDIFYFTLDIGVPHLIIMVDDIWSINIKEIKTKFKNRQEFDITIFSTTQILENLNARTYINGVGEVLSNSEGASSAFYIYRKFYNGPRRIIVHFNGGDIVVEEGGYGQILTTLKPKKIFKGEISI